MNGRFAVALLLVLDALMLTGCARASSGEAQVTGAVTYLERIALPPDAVVLVRIENISRADVAAEIISEQEIPTEGKQVPIPFELPYDPEAINERDTYNLAARILDGQGNLLFISDTVVPVITKGNPTQDVEVVVVQIKR
jgi:putative lipoprotein